MTCIYHSILVVAPSRGGVGTYPFPFERLRPAVVTEYQAYHFLHDLVARAFSLGVNPEIFEATAHGAELKNVPEKLRRICRDCGPGSIGKLANTIRRSLRQQVNFERIKIEQVW
jgi:hypothetical protein